MLDVYSLKALVDEKIAEARQSAARDGLALRVERAAREAQQPDGSWLAGLLRTLASAFSRSRPVLEDTVTAGHAR